MNKSLILITIFLTIFLDFFNLGLIYPIFSMLLFEGEGSFLALDASNFLKNSVFGLLIAAFPLGQFLGAPILGQLSDIHGRRKLLIFSLIGTVATLLICSVGILLSSLFLLLLGRFIGGLMAGNMTLAYATLADFSHEKEKVRNFAWIPLATSAGFALGPYFSAMVAQHLISLPFFIASFFSLINLGLVLWIFPETSTPKVQKISVKQCYASFTNFLKCFKSTQMRPYLWILFFMISANFLFVQFAGPFAIYRFQISIKELGYLYANMGFSVALGHLFLTRQLARYLSSETALSSSLVALALLLIALLFSVNLLMLHLVTCGVMLACAIGYTNSMTLVSNQASKDRQGEIMGIAVSIQNCAEFLPALLLGLAAAFSQSIPLLAAALSAVLSYLILFKTTKASASEISNSTNPK